MKKTNSIRSLYGSLLASIGRESNPTKPTRLPGLRVSFATPVFLFLLALAALAVPQRAFAGPFAATSLSPSTQTNNVGTPVTVDVVYAIGNTTYGSTYGIDLRIDFDPAMLQVASVTTGTNSPFTTLVADKNLVDNSAGFLRFGATGPNRANVTYAVARIVFTPIAAGTSPLHLHEVRQYFSGYGPFGIDGSASSGSIKINAAAPAISFGVPQRTGWGIGASFGHIFSKTGLPDVLSSRDGQSTYVNLWKNNADGTFTDYTGFFLPGGLGGNNTEQSFLADMNNDGFDDIVAIARSGLAIFLNDGQGNFTQSALYPETGSANAYFPGNFQSVRMAVARTSPGGNFDVLVSGAGQVNKWLVFHGNGDGTVAPSPVTLTVSADRAAYVRFIDLDGSGYLGVTGGVIDGNPVTFFRNNHDGTYSPAFSAPADNQNVYQMDAVSIDMDNDGILDLVVTTGDGNNNWDANIYWYKGTGGGNFSSTRRTAFNGHSQRWTGSTWSSDWFYDTLKAVDVDGDGKVDLIGTTQNSAPAVLRNNGDGTFTKVWESSLTDTQGRVAFAAKAFYVDVTGTGPSLIGGNGVFNAFQTFSSFGEYWGPMIGSKPVDKTAPVITAPANITAEATSPSGAVVNFTATAQDNVDGAVNVTASKASGSTFALGVTTVQLSASDAAGNTAQTSFTVTVRDTTPPVISAPAVITAEATGPDGSPITYFATATDLVSGNVTVTANLPSGSTLPIGYTSVMLSATDAAGNTASESIFVTVRDTVAPALSLPANLVLEATSAAGSAATFAATAKDAVGVTSLTYSAASGSTFPIGTTTVTVTAKDAANNTTSGSFTVTVRDTTAPVISLPANQVIEATSAAGSAASFTANATDAVGVASLTYSAASGSTFSIGTTTVTVTATDAANNTTSGSFTVTVRDTTAPALTVPANQVVEATSAAGATAAFAATATDAVGVTSLTYSKASGSTFPLGTTTVTVSATDAAGNTTMGSFTITVLDTTPAVITSVTPSSGTLWPPNNKMVPIAINVVATDAVGIASAKIISVASNQLDKLTQWQITGPLTVNLLASRNGNEGIRTYTLTIEVRDTSGNVSTGTTTVIVPHDQSGK